ncbi:hypothetical protein [Polymorphobacter fuscus]|uniref:17 kDa surface antigen n=1 Tax=Sandarakinorhabdus fusca TaxID=1439888 RepID=A0A7C9KXN0_9SPHN|nr:hypothetical protein [Polymorphobacter fuscus]KAB7647893.1 hypothetical protein F9290_08010 [Polymorphobacter fuscus]MQT17206.1 hypothetical protein [Polymorphobacter fuscus]NJC08800.1 hypothetical protein [Polymorphobacter fuscus]
MSKILHAAVAAAVLAGGLATPVVAKDNNRQRYEYNGRTYNSLAACREKKRKSTKDGTIVGAAAAGIGAAVLGANLGESALIAGGGALVGNQLGKTKKC